MNYELDLKRVIICCKEDITIDQIKDDTDLVRDLGFDSINMIQLIVEFEKNFDIEIDDEYLTFEFLSSYQKLKEILKKKGLSDECTS